VPVAHKLGINMTWLAVLIAVNLQTSFMHPRSGSPCITSGAWRRHRCEHPRSIGAQCPSCSFSC
jgi:hypothetical protein